MDATVKADPVGFILQREDTCQMVMAAAEEDLVEETEYCTKNAHHMDSLLPSVQVVTTEREPSLRGK